MKNDTICSVDRYNELVNHYNRKGCLTNNYLFPGEIEELIKQNCLFASCETNNVFLFVKKDECQRVYYYINDLNEAIKLDNDDNYVTEILFRGESRYPQQEVEFLKDCGMQPHLIRDQYEAKFSELQPALRISIPNDIVVQYADNETDAKYAIDLFNSLFDHYSGDYLPEHDAKRLIEEKGLLMAYHKGNPCGSLHVERNRACWIAHLAVGENARGKHIASLLIKRYVEMNYTDEKMRYAVWVQHQNEPAVKLYQKSGFKYVNKSTLSMLKLK